MLFLKYHRWKPLTIITKRFILDVAAALDPPLPVEEPCIQQTFKGIVPKKS